MRTVGAAKEFNVSESSNAPVGRVDGGELVVGLTLWWRDASILSSVPQVYAGGRSDGRSFWKQRLFG